MPLRRLLIRMPQPKQNIFRERLRRELHADRHPARREPARRRQRRYSKELEGPRETGQLRHEGVHFRLATRP
jgi:hypothetical protein